MRISHPRIRRARRSLLWSAALFLAINLAANAALPRLLECWRDPAYYLRRERLVRRLETAPGRDPPVPLVVMLGSSRAVNGFDAGQVERSLRETVGRDVRVANFGSMGAGPVHWLVYLGRLLREGPRPDLLLVEVMPAWLSHEARDVALCGQIADLSEDDVAWLEGLNAPRLNQERKRRGDSPLALWNYRTELLRAVAPRLLAADFGARWVRRSDAWGTKKEASLPPDSRRQKRLLSSVRHVFEKWIGNLRLGGPGLEGLEVLLRVCRERGIPVALVVMPEGPEFRSWYRDGSREAVLLEAQQMGRRWDCSLINAWEWFPEPAFRDSLHLASDAAEEFSRRLASEELAPLLDRAVSVARAAAPHRSRR